MKRCAELRMFRRLPAVARCPLPMQTATKTIVSLTTQLSLVAAINLNDAGIMNHSTDRSALPLPLHHLPSSVEPLIPPEISRIFHALTKPGCEPQMLTHE